MEQIQPKVGLGKLIIRVRSFEIEVYQSQVGQSFFKLLFGCLTANFGPSSRGQPH